MIKKLLTLFICISMPLLSLYSDSKETQPLSDTFLLGTGHILPIRFVSRQGNILLSTSNDNSVKLWDLSTGKLMDSFTFRGMVTSATMTKDGQNLIITDDTDSILKVDIPSGLTVQESKIQFATQYSLCESYLLGESLILVSNSLILALDTQSLEQQWSVRMSDHFDSSYDTRWNISKKGDELFCTDGLEILTVNIYNGSAAKIKLDENYISYVENLWVLDKDHILNNQYRDLNYFTSSRHENIDFSSEEGDIIYTQGSYFAVKNQFIHLFDNKMKEINLLSPGLSEITDRNVFFPDESSVAITTPDGNIYFYAHPSDRNAEPLVLGEIKITPTGLLVLADKKSQFITAARYGRTVRSWQTGTGAPRRIFTSEEDVKFLCLNTAQDTLFVGTKHYISAVNLNSMQEKSRFEAPSAIYGMAYSARLDALVSYQYGNEGQVLSIWYWKEKDSAPGLIPLTEGYRNRRIFPLDDKHILYTNMKDFYECYDMETQTKVWEIRKKISNFRDLHYGMEEGHFLLVKADGRIYRESAPGQLMESVKLGNYSSDRYFTSVDISPQSSILAAGSSTGELLYFDMTTNELIHTIKTGSQAIQNLHICDSSYGRELLFSDSTGVLTQWTRINDKCKFLSYSLGESSLVLKPMRDRILPKYQGEITEESGVFTPRSRLIPEITESEWELTEVQDKKTLRISCESVNIPDGTTVRGRVYQSTGDGSFIKEIQSELTGTIINGKAEMSWETVDSRESNEISPLWFNYVLETNYTDQWKGKALQVTYPEIQEFFWYSDQCTAADPAILSLVVKDLNPKDKLSIEFFESKDRISASTVMEGFRIGDMDTPIMIDRQKFLNKGLKKNQPYFVTLHTESGIDFPIDEPVSYQ